MIARLQVLLRGDADRVAESVSRAGFESIAQFSLIILMGAGVYGATLGLWRGPLQAFYTAIKFPLVIFLTCLGNGAINGMLAQILGSGLSFRQTAVAILMSFAIAAIILAGFAPLTLFVWFNAPPLESKGRNPGAQCHVTDACFRHRPCRRDCESQAARIIAQDERERQSRARRAVQLAGGKSVPWSANRLDSPAVYRLTKASD